MDGDLARLTPKHVQVMAASRASGAAVAVSPADVATICRDQAVGSPQIGVIVRADMASRVVRVDRQETLGAIGVIFMRDGLLVARVAARLVGITTVSAIEDVKLAHHLRGHACPLQ